MDEDCRFSFATCIENMRIAYLLAASENDPAFQAQLTRIAELWRTLATRLAPTKTAERPASHDTAHHAQN